MAEPEWATSDPATAKADADAKAKEQAEMQRLADDEARRVTQSKAQDDAVANATERERAKYEARMNQLETLLQNKWSAKDQPPQQQMRPQVTEEDFLDPRKALEASRRLAQEAAADAAAYVSQQHAADSADLRELQFDTIHDKLKQDPLYRYVADDIQAAMNTNPNLRRAPKALQILYDNLKGRRAMEIAEGERNAYLDNERKRKLDPSSSPISTSIAPPRRPTADVGDTGPKLSTAETEFLSKFQRLGGVKISPERWAELKAQRDRDRSDVPNMEDRGR